MAADVLLYNALNEDNQSLINQNAELDTNIAAQNALCSSSQALIDANSPQLVANSGPNQARMWCLIPEGSSWVGGFKVCDTSGDFRCDSCCEWVVPAGVTCARFQIWGAGAGTGSACCCGFTPIGGTGAYASVIIPVSEGDTYTLCGGCAFCCYGCRGQNDADGCASFIIGNGLTNFCAEGGEGSIYCEIQTRCAGSYCMYLGGCICNSGTDVCWNTQQQGYMGCDQRLGYSMISSCKTYYGTAASGTVYGVRGSFGFISVHCDGQICVQHPPIYGFAASSCCSCCIATVDRQGCERSATNGYMQIPGAGGWAGYKCAGQTNCAGDAGRMGMVCVSYK